LVGQAADIARVRGRHRAARRRAKPALEHRDPDAGRASGSAGAHDLDRRRGANLSRVDSTGVRPSRSACSGRGLPRLPADGARKRQRGHGPPPEPALPGRPAGAGAYRLYGGTLPEEEYGDPLTAEPISATNYVDTTP